MRCSLRAVSTQAATPLNTTMWCLSMMSMTLHSIVGEALFDQRRTT